MFRQTFCKKLSFLKKIISPSLLNCVLACSLALRVYVPLCSRAWRAYVLTCLVCLRVSVLTCMACLRFACLRAWRAYVFACLRTWRVYVLAYLRAWCACVCTCVLVMMKCFIFLRVCVLGVLFCLICFTFQYLNLKILRAKKLCALLS